MKQKCAPRRSSLGNRKNSVHTKSRPLECWLKGGTGEATKNGESVLAFWRFFSMEKEVFCLGVGWRHVL